jgi:hypothetical protein
MFCARLSIASKHSSELLPVKKVICWFAFGLASFAITMRSPPHSLAADPPAGKAPADTRPVAKKTAAESTSAKEVTEQEAKDWAAALQRAMLARDLGAAERLLDWSDLVDSAMGTPGWASRARKDDQLTSEVRGVPKEQRFSPEKGFAGSIIRGLGAGADYRALHIHRQDGRQRALFRLIGANGAVNYHDYMLTRSAAGKIVATDCYLCTMGVLLSETFRLAFLQKPGADTARLSGAEKDYVAHAAEIENIRLDAREKKWPQVLAALKRLPPSVQASKLVMPTRILAAQQSNEAEYLAVIDEFRKNYANDPMLDLISIDGYVLRGQYDKADQCIQRVNRAVGGDPYLKVMRANMLTAQEKLDAAHELLQTAVAEEPTLLRAYNALIDGSLARHDFIETFEWLTAAETHGARFGDLTKLSQFAEFVKSPQYQIWLKSHSEKDQATSKDRPAPLGNFKFKGGDR